MKNDTNTTAPSASASLAFGPKDIRAKYESLVDEFAAAGAITLGKSASCSKATFLSIYAAMLAEMGVIAPEHVSAAYSIFDELPANASAMRQDFEKWNEAEAASSKKANALLGKYGSPT